MAYEDLTMKEKEIAQGKRFRLKISRVLIILLIAGAGAFVYYRLSLKSKLQARINAIRDADYPVTCAELDKWYTIPENAENAADTIMDAFWCYRETGETKSLLINYLEGFFYRTKPLPEEKKVSIVQSIADNNETLTLLHKAATIKYCRYPIDLSSGFNANLNYLRKLWKCIILLNIDAIWHAENGQSQSAANSVISSLCLARSLAEEPVIESQLVRMTCYSLIISNLESCINRTTFTDEQLVSINRCLIGAENHSTLARAYAGDRCLFLDALKKLESLKPTVTMSGRQITPMYAPFSRLYKAVGLTDMDAIIYLDVIDRYIEITKLPLHQRRKASDALEAGLVSISNIHVLLHMLIPNISRDATKELESIVDLHAARASLAVERYRLAAGKLPDSLSELVPAYLESVPIDPFDGNEMRYKKFKTGFVVYSVGEDLNDDGGKEITSESENWDMTFIVER